MAKSSRCDRCRYGFSLSGGLTRGRVCGCQYILVTGHVRPCRDPGTAGERCTDYVPRGRGKRDSEQDSFCSS